VEGLIRLMSSDDDFTGPVNLGNPGEFSILELAQKVIAATGSRSDLIYNDLPSDDPRQRKPDISLAQKVLHWTPAVQLEEGLKHTIDYFRELLSQQ
jgi:UDP-glucuronate decarboxylase